LKYRAEIDGLRALAVVPVILFHAGLELFSGGFVGVDVFFVISGYLITTILIEDIENKRLSIVNFYERRARRILPALFLVMTVCIPFAWLWMSPNQMKDFSQSLVAVSLFSSNILFWRESGYFDAAAEEKPLLHTWSLAVEEQYYVLFPIFLILAWRFGKNRVFWMIVVIAAISLLLSEWGWRNKATANFYLAPTRSWELFAGSIAAFIVQKQGVQKNNLLATLGLAAIIFSILFYDKNIPFPSVYTLMPVLGVVLLVLFAEKETIAAKLLGTKVFVGLGLISYSAYLWHQPLFAFARIRMETHPPLKWMLLLSVVSLFLAFFSWKYVETPFRKKNIFQKRKLFLISIFGILSLSIAGLLGHYTNGFPNRTPNIVMEIYSRSLVLNPNENNCHLGPGYNESDLIHPIKTCTEFMPSGTPSLVMIGDSHLGATGYALQRQLIENSIESYSVSYTGCIPIRGLQILQQSSEHRCAEYNESMIEYAKKVSAETIVLVGRWDQYILGTAYDNGEGALENNGQDFGATDTLFTGSINLTSREDRVRQQIVQQLNELSNDFKVYVVEPIPVPAWHVPNDFVSRSSFSEYNRTYSLQNYNHRMEDFRLIFDELNPSITVIQTSPTFCVSDRCIVQKDGELIYRDTNHLSMFGADMLAHYIVERIVLDDE